MVSTRGVEIAITAKTVRSPHATSRATSSAMTIWTPTAHGVRIPPTAPFGYLQALRSAGLHITPATGHTKLLGDGRGSTTHLGALRHSTMDAGPMSAALGRGCPVR